MKKFIFVVLVAAFALVGCQNTKNDNAKQNGNTSETGYDYIEATEDVIFTLESEPAFTIKAGTVVMIDHLSEGYEVMISDQTYKTASQALRGVDQIPVEPTVMMISADRITLKAGTQLVDKDNQVLFVIDSDFQPIHYIRQMDIHGELMYELTFCGRLVYASPKTVVSDFD